MPNKNKNSNGPKTDEGKAISSRNSITHGLTARHWLDTNEQASFDAFVEGFNGDFDPQTSIEKVLIFKLAELCVRLIRMQRVENSMFSLASSEAGHPEEAIKSLDNGSGRLIQPVGEAGSVNWQFNPRTYVKKTMILDEIDSPNLDDITGWAYVEDNMPITAKYIIKRCANENLNLHDFITREIDQAKNEIIKIDLAEEDSFDENTSLSIEEFAESAYQVPSSSLKKYLNQFAHGLIEDLQAQLILRGLDERTQQIKDAAMPDPQKLSLIQRYRTTDERQFSKTLKELIRLLQMRKNI